jgi:hypothetical protein
MSTQQSFLVCDSSNLANFKELGANDQRILHDRHMDPIGGHWPSQLEHDCISTGFGCVRLRNLATERVEQLEGRIGKLHRIRLWPRHCTSVQLHGTLQRQPMNAIFRELLAESA